MENKEVLSKLIKFVAEDILKGEGGDLNESTPLLELGILDSLAMVKTIAFAEEEFRVQIPTEKINPENFCDLKTLSSLILKLSA